MLAPPRSTPAILAIGLAFVTASCGDDTASPNGLDSGNGARSQLLSEPFQSPAVRLLDEISGLGEARSQVVYEADLSEYDDTEAPLGWHAFERLDIGGTSFVRVIDGGPGELEVEIDVLEGPAHVFVARLPVSSGSMPKDATQAVAWIRQQFQKGDQRDASVAEEDVDADDLVAHLPINPDFAEPLSSLVLISLDYKPGSSRFGNVQLRRVPSFEIQYRSAVYGTPDYSEGPIRGRVNLGGDHRDALVLPVGESRAVSVSAREGCNVLEFSLGALSGVDPLELASVQMNISVRVGEGKSHALPAMLLAPQLHPIDRTWRDFSLDLSEYFKGSDSNEVEVTFNASDPQITGRPLAVAIAHPRLIGGVSERARPNLILISLDTMRADRVGAIRTDDEVSLTPNLDAFAESALLFSAAASTAPFTLPSHGSVFSGRMPSAHGGVDMQTPLRLDTPLLTELIALAGWSTTAFTGGGFLSPDFGFSRGFDRYTVHDPLITTETLPELPANVDGVAPEVMSSTEYEDYLRLSAAWRLKKEAVADYLASAADSPYFLFLHTYAAHQYHPPRAIYDDVLRDSKSELTFGKHLGSIAPERWRNSPPSEADTEHMRRLYDACVRHADDEFGAVMEILQRTGGLENTYVVVFSDHGEELFEHGELGHSDSLRESLLHVPLLLAGPGIKPGRMTEPVSLLDLAPTLFELLGLPETELFEGSPLLAYDGFGFALRQESAPVFSEVSHHGIHQDSLRAGNWKVVRDYGPAGRGVGTPTDSLYNLVEDGAEFTDLSLDEQRLFERLLQRLVENRKKLDAAASGLAEHAAEISAGTMDALGDLGYL